MTSRTWFYLGALAVLAYWLNKRAPIITIAPRAGSYVKDKLNPGFILN